MTQAILTQILEQLEMLEQEELQQLNQALQKYLTNPDQEAVKQATFHQALLTSGLVQQLKRPSQEQIPERQLFKVQGKPVSETIISERR